MQLKTMFMCAVALPLCLIFSLQGVTSTLPETPEKAVITGAACAIYSQSADGNTKIFVVDGDRNEMPDDFKSEWKSQFFGKAPPTVYRVDPEEDLIIPGRVMTDGKPKTLTKREEGRAILKHLLSKSYVPKSVFQTAEESEGVSADDVPDEKVDALVKMLQRFTSKINTDGLSRVEIVMGGHNPSKDDSVENTIEREVYEETGAKGSPKFIGYSDIFEDRYAKIEKAVSALFVLEKTEKEMLGEYNQFKANPETNWFCPFGWFKFIPGINAKEMEDLKAEHETRNGRFISLNDALNALTPVHKRVLKRLVSLEAFNKATSSMEM